MWHDFMFVFLFLLCFKEQLIRKLAVILDVQDEDIIVEHLKEAGVGHRYTNIPKPHSLIELPGQNAAKCYFKG